ncbi:MAG: hypothetical protein ACYTG0_40000, partial [Planctomycetota bacterium]
METYEHNTHSHFEEDLGSYRLVLEAPVSIQDDVWSALGVAEQIAKELDVAWCYVCGSPFFAVRKTFVLAEAPDGWTGNTREVEVEIQKERGLGYVEAAQLAHCHWLSPVVQALVELHIAAHKSDHGSLFFLAKGLELAGAFFGQARGARNSGLQGEMAKIGMAPYLTRSVEWLFEMANTRFDVRHVVNGYSPVAVHPRMDATERGEFETNADLVLRGFICAQLEVDITVLNRPEPQVG